MSALSRNGHAVDAWVADGARISLTELSRLVQGYAQATEYDASLKRLWGQIGGKKMLLTDPDHARAAIVWLRSWQCRHLRRVDTETITVPSLLRWASEWEPRLPKADMSLESLSSGALDDIGRAFGALAESRGARRRWRTGEIDVRIAPTAAAKLLYALCPQSCAPWDRPIRRALRLSGSAEGYTQYLIFITERLDALSKEAGIPISELPAALGRPETSPPKLIDEYLWARISRGL